MGVTYPYGSLPLTELDGFEPTPLELLVVGTPSFQRLRMMGWPNIRWAERITGRRFDAKKAKGHTDHAFDASALAVATTPTDDGPLSPAQAGDLLAHLNLLDDLQSLFILTAKVRRDAQTEKDHDLLYELEWWIDQPGDPYSGHGFRWERFYDQSEYRRKQGIWLDRIKELKKGTSRIVAILRHRLNDEEMETVKEALERKFGFTPGGEDEGEGIFMPNKRLAQSERLKRDLHCPWLACMHCSLDLRNQLRERDHSRCEKKNAFLLVDNPKVDEILNAIPRELRDHARVVRFTVPRWTFRGASGHGGDDALFPQALLLGMDQMKEAQQQACYERVCDWMEKKAAADAKERIERGWGKSRKYQVLLKPLRTPHLNALLIAGSDGSLLRHRPNPRGESLRDILDDYPVLVSKNRVTSQKGFW